MDSSDCEVGQCVNPAPHVSELECALRAIAACLRFIMHFHNQDKTIRTFQVVHTAPRAVSAIMARNDHSFEHMLLIARELYKALPPSLWLVFDAGRHRKSEAHFIELRKRLRP